MIDHGVIAREDGLLDVRTNCVSCDAPKRYTMTGEQYAEWQGRTEMVQNIFPAMNVRDREVLLSGMCGDCFSDLMSVL